MSEQVNDAFGIPEPDVKPADVAVPVVETPEQIEARIRAQAAAAIAKETEAAMLQRFMAEERARAAPVSPEGQGFPAEYDKIEVQMGNQKTDKPYVPLGINGYVIKVPRGEEVIIPHVFVTECLDHAVEEVTVQSEGGYVTRPAHRFQYSFRGKATPEEYKAFLAKQKERAERDIARAA